MNNKKVPLFIIVGIAIVSVGYFVITSKSYEGAIAQPASVADLKIGKEEIPPKNNAARLSVTSAQFQDWPQDTIPGLSPKITSQGTISFPTRTRAYVQYAPTSTFPTASATQVLIPASLVRVTGTNYSITVPAETRLFTLAPETTYYMRIMMQDALNQAYSQAVKVVSPANCNAEFTPNTVPNMNGGLRSGNQTIASFTVKNTCNEPIKFANAEIGIYGLNISNPNITNPVSNIKVYSGTTLLSSPSASHMRYSFADDIISANSTKTYTIKADVPANITTGDYLTTRIEIRGKTPGNQLGDDAPTALFINPRGFSPSVMMGTNTYWQLSY